MLNGQRRATTDQKESSDIKLKARAGNVNVWIQRLRLTCPGTWLGAQRTELSQSDQPVLCIAEAIVSLLLVVTHSCKLSTYQ